MTGVARPERLLACAIGAACAACAACATQDVSPVASTSPRIADGPSSPAGDEAMDELEPHESLEPGVSVESVEPIPLGPADVLSPEAEVWLKGSTHVHGRASGDSSEPPGNVIAWYEQHGYDFIALTDNNRVSELDRGSDTRGQVMLRDPHAGLIVFSGIELTHNPVGCLPIGDPSRNCRIHVNLIGPTARPAGRI